MKFNGIRFIIIVILFHFIFNQYTEIQNLNEITIKEGNSNYTYQYPGTNETDNGNPYFFFKFSTSA